MPIIQSNSINLYYESYGQGEPLVLISGLGYESWMWHKMVPDLAERFQVTTFDNRGCGRSDKPAGPYTAQMLAADTIGLMDALQIERAHVMGHSMGGFVAQALVLDYPDRVDKLILSATNFGGPRHIPITPEAMAVLTDLSGDPIERLRRGIVISCAPGFVEMHPELVEEWINHRIANPIDPAGYQSQLAIGMALFPEAASFEHKLVAIDKPTLILFGAEDKVVPPGNAQLLAGKIKSATIKILPNAGHFFPLEVAQEAAAAATQFLDSSSPKPDPVTGL